MGDTVDAASLVDRSSFLATHLKLVDRLLQVLEEDGTLRRSGHRFEVWAPPLRMNAAATVSALLAKHPSCAAEISLLMRCGERLGDVLSGAADPVQLLFGGTGASAERLYYEAPFALA